MKKSCIALTALLLTDSISGMDGIEFLKKDGHFDSISVTSAHLALRPNTTFYVGVSQEREGQWVGSLISKYLENNEDVILRPDQETQFSDVWHNTFLFFKPVTYKNQLKGFRISEVSYARSQGLGRPRKTYNVAYLALSDTPVQVGADDVEEASRPLSNMEFYIVDWERWLKQGTEARIAATREEEKRSPPNLDLDGIAYLKNLNWFDSITVTATNIVFMFNDTFRFREVHVGRYHDKEYPVDRTIKTPIENNENVVLPIGCTIGFAATSHSPDRDRGGVRLTPVIFKNKLNGFRISEVHNFGRDIYHVAYIALSETPTKVSQTDVEKIRVWKRSQHGDLSAPEWKTPEEIRTLILTESIAEPQFRLTDIADKRNWEKMSLFLRE